MQDSLKREDLLLMHAGCRSCPRIPTLPVKAVTSDGGICLQVRRDHLQLSHLH